MAEVGNLTAAEHPVILIQQVAMIIVVVQMIRHAAIVVVRVATRRVAAIALAVVTKKVWYESY
jgi:hypothetical protein